MRASRSIVVAAIALATPSTGAEATRDSHAAGQPTDGDVRRWLVERVEALGGPGTGIGIVVGVVGPKGRRIVAYGRRAEGDARPLDGDTVFEIGSVGKVFTALLLADMVRRNEVVLDDPVVKHLPDISIHPRGRAITLLDLATHTSGLPFMPDNVPAFDDRTPYGAAQLSAYLARVEPRVAGAQWDYSNLGYWLLGQALAVRAGMDYATLLQTRMIGPLSLRNTAAGPSREIEGRLAVGHDAVLHPAPQGSAVPLFAAMPAAGGGVVSTANDLLSLLAVMDDARSPLGAAMALTLRTTRSMPRPESRQALGWIVIGDGPDQLIFHDGSTLGFASAVAWDPARHTGVVVLSNQVTSVADLAHHLLRPSAPLEKPTATRRTEIPLDPSLVDHYVGRYDEPDEGTFVVARERDFLTITLPPEWGLPRMRLRPESRRDFFASELPLRVTFEEDAAGVVTGLIVHPPRGQPPIRATRPSPKP